MPLTPSEKQPAPDGTNRTSISKDLRKAATADSGPAGAVTTQRNTDEDTMGQFVPANFTKGLPHDALGIVDDAAYEEFVRAINAVPGSAKTTFDVPLGPKHAVGSNRPANWSDDARLLKAFNTTLPDGARPQMRRWESPRAGHAYDLQGPDGAEVAMAPAPALGSDELAAEMAEVYGLALLRDVPFKDIAANSTTAGPAGVSPAQVLGALNAVPWFSTATTGTSEARRAARLNSGGSLGADVVFRGSTPGAKAGPYMSQFLLQGSKDAPRSGLVGFGAQQVNQRVSPYAEGLDYMTDWASWLDVQMGADMRPAQSAEVRLKFITTPRDLARYVHIDALYQAYLVATLLLQSYVGTGGLRYDAGLPEPNPADTREGFATFGGPHILSLVTEVATRALKAVRRQKFNHHRRGRPERIGGLISLGQGGQTAGFGTAASDAITALHGTLEGTGMLEWVRDHNARQFTHPDQPLANRANPGWIAGSNNLLPMAFAEGSPMHPAYGAGHATVAGACVTILKAFFGVLDASLQPITLTQAGFVEVLQSTHNGKRLGSAGVSPSDLTVEGELDKLAANISIGRNMAGVHFYSDYFDSLRMGERVAVGMLMEQAKTYAENISMTFHSFDGDLLAVTGTLNPTAPSQSQSDLSVNGGAITVADWWTRYRL